MDPNNKVDMVEHVKQIALNLELQAKRKEMLVNLSKNNMQIDDYEDINNAYLRAIETKIAILQDIWYTYIHE